MIRGPSDCYRIFAGDGRPSKAGFSFLGLSISSYRGIRPASQSEIWLARLLRILIRVERLKQLRPYMVRVEDR
jgi:hypothetical protein